MLLDEFLKILKANQVKEKVRKSPRFGVGISRRHSHESCIQEGTQQRM